MIISTKLLPVNIAISGKIVLREENAKYSKEYSQFNNKTLKEKVMVNTRRSNPNFFVCVRAIFDFSYCLADIPLAGG
jgi:hypothetical protein